MRREERIEAAKKYLSSIGLTCGEDIYQADRISSDVHNILDKVLTILFGEDYDLYEEEEND